MKDFVIASAMAIALAGQLAAAQQQTAQQVAQSALPDAPQQQQQVPDAPKPQLTGVGPITPGKGTTPTFNGIAPVGSSASALPPDLDQPDLDNPTSATPPPGMTDEEQGAPPVVSRGSDIFLLPSITVNSVEVPFTVKDTKGKLVPGITWRDVQVYENGLRQKMQVYTVDPFPLSVALVIDNSMEYHDMERVNNSLGALQAAFSNYDSVSVFTYNNGAKMLSDMTGGQSARLTVAIERSKSTGRDQMYYAPGEALENGIILNGGANQNEVLTGHQPGSPQGVGSAQVQRQYHPLNDAILLAAQSVAKAPKGRRRIVYIISDGKEYGSKASTKQVIKYLETNKIEVVASLVGDVSVKGMGFVESVHLPLMMRDNVLPVYTKATGGEFYADYRTKGIEESFAKLTEDARTQYTVWYNSREPMIDGKFRKVEVKVLRPNLQVIAKQGYYPTVTEMAPRTTPVSAPVTPQ